MSINNNSDNIQENVVVQYACKEMDQFEPFLMEDTSRFLQRPIKYPDIWENCKISIASFWTTEEVDMSGDIDDWKKLNKDEKHFISHILAFFAGADGIVMENLSSNFSVEVQIPEVRSFFAFQNHIESVHSDVYAKLIETLITDTTEQKRLFEAIDNIPVIAKKAQWSFNYMDNKNCFAQRLVGFALVEGLFFSGAFCAIFWLKQRGIMNGLTFSNELISRDEGQHLGNLCLIYRKYLKLKLSEDTVREIVMSAVDIEKEFIIASLPVKLLGMNSDLMSEYIEFVADYIMEMLGHNKIYNVSNPFPFMDLIAIEGKTNFFERRVGEYQRSNVINDISKLKTNNNSQDDTKNIDLMFNDDF